ncbi:MAG: dihydroneopterin aldolase [Bacteroidales bacterium]|nr:dihydroneopterin aldolase [Bacteroidales bacterium]
MALIEIEGMEFYSFHGHFREEQVVGNRFLVDVQLEVDSAVAQQTDELADTVNYVQVYQIIKEQMAIKSKLLEHLAERIVTAIHAAQPQVRRVRIKVSKMNPPVGGKMSCVSFTLER